MGPTIMASSSLNHKAHRHHTVTLSSENSLKLSSEDGDCSYLVPEDYGLWIRLNEQRVSLAIEKDKHYSHIHPNCFAPASLEQVRLLKGGGSGTAVFGGTHDKLGKIVMKHGGFKDTKEVFSLARIQRELLYERANSKSSSMQLQAAAQHMAARIPQFVGCYISLYHLRDRNKELWHVLRKGVISGLLFEQQFDHETTSSDESEDEEEPIHVSTREDEERMIHQAKQSGDLSELQQVTFQIEKEHQERRSLEVRLGEDVGFEVCFRTVILHIPEYRRDGTVSKGYDFLDDFALELAEAQAINSWKVTLAQKEIGGSTSENGATCLTRGNLKGKLLDTLLDEFTLVIRNLRLLTHDDEREALVQVKAELPELERTQNVKALSKTADALVGNAILKNFTPKTGRFDRLRELGKKIRAGKLLLTPNEEMPAVFLAMLLERGANLDTVFVDPPSRYSALDAMEHSWMDLLQHATSFEHKSATDRIWTCGLTDAGLHNTFICQDKGLELFDLGPPQLVPQPAFLTKFLMSFFHAFGMEEDSQGGWVRRFQIVDFKLCLTTHTRDVIPYVYDAYCKSLDHFIKELFDNDESVRLLLVKYTILQLLSDAAFCLARWEVKGGGRQRFGECADLEKWLWRSLWDLYIASNVHKTFFEKC